MPGGDVVVAGASFPSLDTERSFVEPLGCTVVDKRFAPDDEALEACRTAVAVMTDYFVCDAARIATFERCKVICQYGAGLNQVDVAAATAAGIYVTHTPDYCSEELGDHTMALILASMRRIVRFDRNIRAGRWDYNDGMPMRRLAACTLGLVGFGRAARAVAVRAQGFGMTVIAHDPLVDDATFAAAGVARAGELPELLTAADVVSIHVPLVQSTRHLIGTEQAGPAARRCVHREHVPRWRDRSAGSACRTGHRSTRRSRPRRPGTGATGAERSAPVLRGRRADAAHGLPLGRIS